MSKTAAIDPDTPVPMLRWLSANKTYHELLANNVSCPPDILQKLSDSKSIAVRQAVAAHANTPVETLRKLANDERVSVCIAVGTNPATPRDIVASLPDERMEALIRSELNNITFLRELLVLPNVKEILLRRFSKHTSKELRAAVASNVQSPSALLEEMSSDEAFEVRWACAKNQNATGALLEKLSRDAVWGVRWMVAQHPNTPSTILHRLLLDSAQEVILAADANLKKRAV